MIASKKEFNEISMCCLNCNETLLAKQFSERMLLPTVHLLVLVVAVVIIVVVVGVVDVEVVVVAVEVVVFPVVVVVFPVVVVVVTVVVVVVTVVVVVVTVVEVAVVEVQRTVKLLILVYTTRSPVSNNFRMAPGRPLVPEAHLAELPALYRTKLPSGCILATMAPEFMVLEAHITFWSLVR